MTNLFSIFTFCRRFGFVSRSTSQFIFFMRHLQYQLDSAAVQSKAGLKTLLHFYRSFKRCHLASLLFESGYSKLSVRFCLLSLLKRLLPKNETSLECFSRKSIQVQLLLLLTLMSRNIQ